MAENRCSPPGATCCQEVGHQPRPPAGDCHLPGRPTAVRGRRGFGRVYQIEAESGAVEQIADVEGFVLGLCLDAGHYIYACVERSVLRIDRRDGSSTIYSDHSPVGRYILPNFVAFGPDGSLFMSDSGDNHAAGRPGRLHRIPVGGGTSDMLDTGPLAFPNGLAFADGVLYVAESGTGRILRCDDSGKCEEIASTPEGVVDGIVLDSQGGILVTLFQPNGILRFGPQGQLDWTIIDPSGWRILTPTNAAFYGPRLGELALASLCGWEIVSLTVDVAGQPLTYPAMPA
ncbi:MAG: SMP-30/gluconolactonase/LRE family protein [Nocardioidaceae bacterium]